MTRRVSRPFKPKTLRAYQQALRLRVVPELGHERLGELSLPKLQRYVDRLAARSWPPRRSADGRAAPGDLRAGEPARRGGHQPDARARAPGRGRSRARIASPDEISHAPGASPGDRALWATAFYAGLRRGELLRPAPGGRRPRRRRDPRPPRLGRRRGRDRAKSAPAAGGCRSPRRYATTCSSAASTRARASTCSAVRARPAGWRSAPPPRSRGPASGARDPRRAPHLRQPDDRRRA